MGRKKKPESQIKKEIKKTVKTLVSKVEPKKRGNKPGSVRGPYKKKNNLPITNLPNNEAVITDSNTTNNSINSFSNNNDNVGKEVLHTEKLSEVTPENLNSNNDNITGSVNSSGNSINSDADILNEFISKEGTKKELVYEPDNIDTSIKPVYTQDNVSFGSQKQMISGFMLLAFCDMLFPTVIYKLMIYTNPEYKGIDKQKIKLTAEQKKDLEPAANEVAKYVFEKISPLAAFLVGLTMCYGSNFMDASEQLKTKLKEEQKNKPLIEKQIERINEIKKEVESKETKTKFKNKR